jgi:hypothetical protein
MVHHHLLEEVQSFVLLLVVLELGLQPVHLISLLLLFLLQLLDLDFLLLHLLSNHLQGLNVLF